MTRLPSNAGIAAIDGQKRTGTESVRVLYLTDNPTLGGTIRILQSWLLIGRRDAVVDGYVVIPHGSDFHHWLDANQIVHTTSSFPVPSKTRPWTALLEAWRIRRWMKAHRIQLIHCNEHNIYPFAAFLRRVTGLPLVCHVRYRIARDYAQWAFGGAARQPDALLWTSRQQQADCAEAIAGIVPAERQHLVPLGVDLDVFGSRAAERDATRAAWGFGPDDILVGQACAMRPRKRIEEFVDIVAALVRDNPRVAGVLAGDAMPGDEEYRDRVLRHIESRKLGDRFKWLGNIDDVEPFDQAIDIFMSTSDYETFGNSVCEAMACGRPIVGYRGGSIVEIAGDAGIIVPDGDVPALTAAARQYVSDAGLRHTIGERARGIVRDRFSPAATLRQLLGLYRTLLST